MEIKETLNQAFQNISKTQALKNSKVKQNLEKVKKKPEETQKWQFWLS